jgi:hypothetical protein
MENRQFGRRESNGTAKAEGENGGEREEGEEEEEEEGGEEKFMSDRRVVERDDDVAKVNFIVIRNYLVYSKRIGTGTDSDPDPSLSSIP